MTSKFYWISLLFMLICNIFMFFNLIKKDKKIHNIEMHNIKDDLMIHENCMLYESLDLSLGNLNVCKGKDTESFLIDKLVETPKLVFRYNLNMCPPCIQSVIYSIKEVFPDYENIIFSCTDLDTHLKSSFNGKVNFSFIDKNSYFPIDSYNIPYLYVIDNDLKMKFLFVASKNNKQKTIDYLKIIKERCSI